uniref:Uncharacterized protein n=1 Tax=Triticum urartu TaxID=4572 RepID=A0A8R7UUX0_TRIUA
MEYARVVRWPAVDAGGIHTCLKRPINPSFHSPRTIKPTQIALQRVPKRSIQASHDEILPLPRPPRRPERRRVRRGAGGGLRLLLPRAAVAGVVLRHEAELLLPAVGEAGGGLRDPRPLAQPRRRLLPAELQPRQRLRSLQGERPAEQPAHGVADAGVPDERRPPVLGARVGEARHLRAEPLQRARLLPDGAPPPRPAPRPRRPHRRGRLPRRRLLHAERHQGRHPAGDRVRALR